MRLVEGIVCLRSLSLIEARQAQVIEGLAIVWIRIAKGQATHGARKVALRFSKFALAQVEQAHGVVQARVFRLALETFDPVGLGRAGGVAVLLQVQPGQVQFLDARDLGRRRRLGGGVGKFAIDVPLRLLGDQFVALHIAHDELEFFGPRAVGFENSCEGLAGRDVRLLVENESAIARQERCGPCAAR